MNQDSVLFLANGWNKAELGLFGDGGSSEATFNNRQPRVGALPSRSPRREWTASSDAVSICSIQSMDPAALTRVRDACCVS